MVEMNELYEGLHCDIVGTTGSGKTTFATVLYQNAPGTAIYVDPSGEVPVEGEVVDMSDGESFDAKLLGEHRRIVIIPPHGTGSEEDMKFIQELQTLLFELGDAIATDEPQFFLFIDEAHELAPLHSDPKNPIIRIAKRGRKRNMRLFLISQSPADLSKKAVKQMEKHVIFAINEYDADYLKRYGMPAEEIREAVGTPDEHKFVIYDGFNLEGPYRLDLD